MRTRSEFGLFLAQRGYRRVAEIGVLRGEFSAQILSQWDGELTVVDAWRSLPGYRDISNVSDEEHERNMAAAEAAIAGRATIVRGLSVEVAGRFPDGHFDLVYLDANHAYEAVLADLKAWDRKAAKAVAGHDYLDGERSEGSFGVRRAVTEFYGREPDIVTREAWPTWVVLK